MHKKASASEVAVYFLPLLLAPGTWVESVLSRLLLFDPVLNLASGAKASAVGATVLTDRALRWGATRLSWKPERLRLVVWLLSMTGTMLCYLLCSK
jgi:hypothetical protein